MMRFNRRRFLALAPTAHRFPVRASAYNGTPIATDLTDRLDAVVLPYAEAETFAGAVLVARGNEPLLRKGYGIANRITGAANTPETAYQIASLTKAFTALACVQLQTAGKLSLDDPITAYLPEVVHAERDGVAMTVRMLLNHTSGVPDFLEFYDVNNPLTYPRTFQQLLTDIIAHELLFTPGTQFAYGNSEYIYAGLIIERVSGLSYEAYLKANIFGPAGMTATYLVDPPSPAPPAAKGYDFLYGQWIATSDFGRVDLVWAAGGITSTVDDLRRWHQALLTETLAPRAAIDAMYRPGLGDYGLGWEIGELAGHSLIGHEGHTIGFDSNLSRFLQDDALIVLLSNIQDAPEHEIVAALAGVLFA